MPVLVALVFAVVAWAIWTKRLKLDQLPAVMLGLAGLIITLKGKFVVGMPVAAIGFLWFSGQYVRRQKATKRQVVSGEIARARAVLGVTALADADFIRARHRKLISENHPDRGGTDDHAAELNKARDLLLAALEEAER